MTPKKSTPKKTTAKKAAPKKAATKIVNGEVPADGRHWLARVQPPEIEALGTTLTPEEVTQVADRLKRESTLIGMARCYRAHRPRVEIPRMSVGHVALKGIEAVGSQVDISEEATQAEPDYNSVEIVTSKVVMPWRVSEEFIEDNKDGDRAIELAGSMMLTQLANDAEDLSVNGDEASADDPLLRANDGWLKLARTHGNLITSEVPAGSPVTYADLERALRALPVKYRRDHSQLRFFVSFDAEMDLWEEMKRQSGGIAPPMDAELNYGEVVIVPIAYFPPGAVLLTDPQNLVFALQDDVKVRASWGGSQAILNNERYFAMHIRMDFAIQNPEAVVLLEKTVIKPVAPTPGLIHRLRLKLALLIDPR